MSSLQGYPWMHLPPQHPGGGAAPLAGVLEPFPTRQRWGRGDCTAQRRPKPCRGLRPEILAPAPPTCRPAGTAFGVCEGRAAQKKALRSATESPAPFAAHSKQAPRKTPRRLVCRKAEFSLCASFHSLQYGSAMEAARQPPSRLDDGRAPRWHSPRLQLHLCTCSDPDSQWLSQTTGLMNARSRERRSSHSRNKGAPPRPRSGQHMPGRPAGAGLAKTERGFQPRSLSGVLREGTRTATRQALALQEARGQNNPLSPRQTPQAQGRGAAPPTCSVRTRAQITQKWFTQMDCSTVNWAPGRAKNLVGLCFSGGGGGFEVTAGGYREFTSPSPLPFFNYLSLFICGPPLHGKRHHSRACCILRKALPA